MSQNIFNVVRSTSTPRGHTQRMKCIRSDQKVQYKLSYTKKDSLFILAIIVFVMMLLIVFVMMLLDSLDLELPSKLQSTFFKSYMFDMPSSSFQRTLNEIFLLSKNT